MKLEQAKQLKIQYLKDSQGNSNLDFVFEFPRLFLVPNSLIAVKVIFQHEGKLDIIFYILVLIFVIFVGDILGILK